MKRETLTEKLKKQKKKKQGKKFLLLTLLTLFLVSVTMLVIVQTLRVLKPHIIEAIKSFNQNYFSISEIAIVGASEFGEKEIRGYVEPIVKVNPNLITFPIASVKLFLATRPYISNAQIRRELPGRLVLSVKEKKTVAILVNKGFYHVDENGFIIRPLSSGENIDVPVITIDDDMGNDQVDDAIKTACLLIELDNGAVPSLSFSEIRITKSSMIARSMDLKNAENYIPPLYLSFEGAEKKILQLKKLWPQLLKKKNEIEYVDGRFRQGVVVKLKTTEERYNG